LPSEFTHDDALDALKKLTGSEVAEFRDGQREAIGLLTEGGKSVICVQRTGWGKSAVYFVATHLMREKGTGPTIIVSPLLALMRNQIAAADRLGVTAATINSANADDWDEIYDDLENDRLDVLIVSPERLANKHFMEIAEPIFERVGLFVVDEAHCISDWGHDFRPDYRRLKKLIERLPASASILCTTATANNRVVGDIEDQLTTSDRPVSEIRGPLEREALRLEVIEIESREEKLAWLATHLDELEGSGIIYCSTIRDTELVTEWLEANDVVAAAYHSGMTDDERQAAEALLINNEVKALVATTALGMGYDKPDLGFVVHFQCPGSAVAYYQQVGRAGRAIENADGILLRGEEDFHIQEFFINTAIPPRDKVMELLGVFDRVDGDEATLGDFEAYMNLGRTRIRAMLTMLEVEGVVERGDGLKWTVTNPDWPYDDERFDALTKLRRHELQQMRVYGTDGECLMQFLRDELDDGGAEPCGRCAVCTQARFTGIGSDETRSAAAVHLKSRTYPIESRKQWAGNRSGRIPADRRAEVGLAISRYNDGGYGSMVAAGKYRDGEFSDELVDVAAERVREWDPSPRIAWVTAVPSRSHPELVPDFARRLAEGLGVPYVASITKSKSTRPQKEMENSFRQAANVFEAFEVDVALVENGPVLLVDDMCDSRWTMAEIAYLLREAGSGPVYPFALADSSNS
jgi:ATP-dependent DNA helicase RecQ